MPTPAWFLAFIVVAAMLPFITSNGYVLRVGFDTLIFMLLALGLNTVVGFAGLLDLGYVAFFGFGAYIYAMLASSQFGLHWPTPVILIVVVPATILLGLLVGLPSRRLVGDYLAIVTLFFGQLFVTVANNGNRISILGFTHGFNITNGPNGITNIDAFHLFGHYLESLKSYYWIALLFFLGVFGTIYLVSNSRTGRAWRSLREDSLAAEMMGMPVNRLKLFAFAFGAGVAGLTGTLFASLQTGVYSADFDTPILITIYAMVILGGAGSLGGMILGAIVVNVSLEVLRTPNHATWVFFVLIIATLLAKLRPWKVLAAVFFGTIAFGFAAYAVITAIWPTANDGTGAVHGRARTRARALGADPGRPDQGRQLGLRRPRRADPGADHRAPVLAQHPARPDALPRGVRLGRPPGVRAEHHPPDHDRRHPDRAHERAPAGPGRREPRGGHGMTDRLLDLRGVSKSFGGLACIQALDLHVDEGEIVSVIGPNGAGKTTLFNLITGVYRTRRGRDRLRREEPARARAAPDRRPRDRADVPVAPAVPRT